MEIKGRILTINVVNDKLAQVVLKKQVAGKYTPIAINVFGYWKDKMQELHLNKGEKISGTIYLKSNLYKGRYYTDVYFKEVDIVESYNPSVITDPNQAQVFTNFDQETGEVFD
jgi:hypothetical protein